MGYEYFKRPVRSVFGQSTLDALKVENEFAVAVESFTSTATIASDEGISLITAATNDRTYLLARPSVAGAVKYVAIDTPAASTDNVALRLESTADTFWGTTFQTLTVSTAGDGPNVFATAIFVAASTSQWALLSKSTGLTAS